MITTTIILVLLTLLVATEPVWALEE